MYTMRTLFAVLALTMAFGFLSEASNNCAENYGITKAMMSVRPFKLTEEQVNCLYDCYTKSIKWFHPNGTFNEQTLSKQNATQRKFALGVVNYCLNEAAKPNATRCSFAGCLITKNFISAYVSHKSEIDNRD